MKTNFSSQTVSGHVSFTFAQMAILTEIFSEAALDATTADNTIKSEWISQIADQLGFEIDSELVSTSGADQPFIAGQAGQDSDQIVPDPES